MECSICLSPYDSETRRPIVGSCGHSFCNQCVSPGISCHLCRRENAFQAETVNYQFLEFLTKTTESLTITEKESSEFREEQLPEPVTPRWFYRHNSLDYDDRPVEIDPASLPILEYESDGSDYPEEIGSQGSQESQHSLESHDHEPEEPQEPQEAPEYFQEPQPVLGSQHVPAPQQPHEAPHSDQSEDSDVSNVVRPRFQIPDHEAPRIGNVMRGRRLFDQAYDYFD